MTTKQSKKIILSSKDPEEILGTLIDIDKSQKAKAVQAYEAYAASDISQAIADDAATRVAVPYAQLRVTTTVRRDAGDIRSVGRWLPYSGTYEGSVTQVDLLSRFFSKNIAAVIANTGRPFEISLAPNEHIPTQIVAPASSVKDLSPLHKKHIPDFLHSLDLFDIDDSIVLGDFLKNGKPDVFPLLPFSASRIDRAVASLPHYTGNDADHFQDHVIFTNYPMYEALFVERCKEIMAGTDDQAARAYRSQYTSFVQPGNHITHNANLTTKAPEGQVNLGRYVNRAYHLKREDGSGITLVNTGVGPSEALKLAQLMGPLRPKLWLMLGHCGGLADGMGLGDLVVPNGYVRDVPFLDKIIPSKVDIGDQTEVHVLLSDAIKHVLGGDDAFDIKRHFRTGKVLTTEIRMWEQMYKEYAQLIYISKAIGVDMESAVLATAAKLYGIPFGSVLSTSDLPGQGIIKLPGNSTDFYNRSKGPHFDISFNAAERARNFPGLESRQNWPGIFAPIFS